MIQTIKKLFSFAPGVDYSQLLTHGALILDVRSTGEYAGGHIEQSMNLPLDQLPGRLSEFKDKNRSIICCCASGMRSNTALGILKKNGFTKVYNGGGWSKLNSKINS